MMRKSGYRLLVAIMTAAVLSLPLAGCSGEKKDEPLVTGRKPSSGASAGNTAGNTGETGDVPEPEAESAVNNTDASIVHYTFPLAKKTLSYNTEDYSGYYHHSYNTLPQRTSYYPEAVENWIAKQTKETEAQASEKLATGEREVRQNDGMYISLYDDYTVFRSDSRVLSVTNKSQVWGGGSAYFTGVREGSYQTYNIDAETGAEIKLTDVVKDLDAFSELVAEQLYARYVDNSPNLNAKLIFESREKLAQDVKSVLEGNWLYADSVYTWAPAYLGLRLRFFDEIASYEGLETFMESGGYYVYDNFLEVTIPYSMAPELFETSYTDLPENWFARIETDTDYEVDLGNGLTTLRVEVPQYEQEEEWGRVTLYSGEVIVKAGGKELTVRNPEISEYMNFGTEVYLARHNGQTFLYVGQRGEYNRLYVEVYEAENGAFRSAGRMEESFETDDYAPLNPEHFYTGIISFILADPFSEGRVSLVRENSLGEDGMPVPFFTAPDTPAFYSVTGEGPEYTLAREVWVPYWDGLGVAVTETGTKVYPAGTKIRMTETDNETCALFDVGEGDERMIVYADRGEYGSVINQIGGMSLDYVLENPYEAFSFNARAIDYVALEPEDMNGHWWDPSTEDSLMLHAWRGEFELSLGTTGDYHAGEIVYNGDSEKPAYTLVTTDGYKLADFCFYTGGLDDYEMEITFHYAISDVTQVFYKPKG